MVGVWLEADSRSHTLPSTPMVKSSDQSTSNRTSSNRWVRSALRWNLALASATKASTPGSVSSRWPPSTIGACAHNTLMGRCD